VTFSFSRKIVYPIANVRRFITIIESAEADSLARLDATEQESGKEATLRLPPPLRTGRESYPFIRLKPS
jgi:hypothetical protein